MDEDTINKIIAAGTGLAAIYGYKNPGDSSSPVGFQGEIPQYTASRQVVPGVYDPERRPGSAGQRYFTDVQYTPKTTQNVMTAEQLSAMNDWVNSLANELGFGQTPSQSAPPSSSAPMPRRKRYSDADVLQYINDAYNRYGGPGREAHSDIAAAMNKYGVTPAQVARIMRLDPAEVEADYRAFGYAEGGIASLIPKNRRGYYLGGETDGMADEVPATIDGVQQAALSDGEFVIPADVVSHLGNGNSDAGAKRLYEMMNRVRKARTGTTEQGRKINPSKLLPG